MTSRYPLKAGTSLLPTRTIFSLSTEIRLAAKIYFAATIPSAKKGREPPPSAPRRSRKSSSSDKPRSSKKSSSSEKILKLMENLVKPLADGFESMRAQQKKTQEQVEALAREDDEDPSSPTDGTTPVPALQATYHPRTRTDESSPRRGRFESSSRHQLSSGIDESTRRHPKKPAHPQAPPD
ncbi:unnamed protein product [Microthlaspi erraticum]|uniref:Uncharacterized protein n=1 Tax=Microthlaspi erraticum TaxID=1685480 RepID=A0A6D2HP67_9BRAS|nr:unnamed protein product [Microthlaspi erraticum]